MDLRNHVLDGVQTPMARGNFWGKRRPYIGTVCRVEMCMGMGKAGIPWVPWDSHGNGNKISYGMGMGWEWE